jgi:uncharacterized Fe-S cluster protein YjdI
VPLGEINSEEPLYICACVRASTCACVPVCLLVFACVACLRVCAHALTCMTARVTACIHARACVRAQMHKLYKVKRAKSADAIT